MKKLTFITGGAVGFVLGSRAGRPAYERIKKAARVVAGSKPVQAAGRKADETVGEFARQRAVDITDSVADAVKNKITTAGRSKPQPDVIEMEDPTTPR